MPPHRLPLRQLLPGPHNPLEIPPHDIILKRKLIQPIRQQRRLRKHLPARPQHPQIDPRPRPVDRVEVVDRARAVACCVPVVSWPDVVRVARGFVAVLTDPEVLVAEDEGVDADADFGGEGEES